MLMPNEGCLPHTSHTAAIDSHTSLDLLPALSRRVPGSFVGVRDGHPIGPAGKVSIPGMQTLDRLGADDLVAVVTTYRDVLRAHKQRINDLNVYPVPDGDTGTNMALTLDSVVAEVGERSIDDGAAEPRDLAAVAKAISHGSLMGARGNSGVILSQILRGLAAAVTDAAEAGGGIDGPVLIDGLVRARDGAYQAVGNPVEGTILTVIRAAADHALRLGAELSEIGEEAGLVDVLEAAWSAATLALAGTTEQLPALKAAGVVDSGGSGLVLLFDAFLHVTDGRPLPEADDPNLPRAPGTPLSTPAPPSERVRSGDVGDLRYEVMYLLEAPDEAIPAFRQVWAGIGDSIVVVGGDGIYNCHIHTDDIGAAIEAALDAGRPRQIRVSDLWEQVEEERWVREAAPEADEVPMEPIGCAVVAVCNGEGIRRIFHSLGVTGTVSGGQSMNPSTADLLAAIEAAPSQEVVVLPNNKNIIPVARAAAEQSTKTVRVVPTVGIPEGFAALLEYDPEGDAEANAELMAENAARVVAGEVTSAVRDSDSPAGAIHAGDWLGITRSGIAVVAPDVADAAIGLLECLVNEAHHEIATIIAGEGAQAADTRRVTEWLAAKWPAVGIEVHQGGQPLYPYLLSIE
jgi:uncharacterized protein